MKCPRDDGTLTAMKYEANIEIDGCGVCGGVWLDAGELERIQETVERDYKKAARTDLVADEIHAAQQAKRDAIQCPKCNGAMTMRRYGMGSAVMIDACDAGCGIWLDKGELEALEKFFEDSRENVEIPVHWRMWASVVSMFKRRS
jgi:uncharacterized protein